MCHALDVSSAARFARTSFSPGNPPYRHSAKQIALRLQALAKNPAPPGVDLLLYFPMWSQLLRPIAVGLSAIKAWVKGRRHSLQARISRTTFPFTSVSRKSRPPWRYVSFS